MPSESMSVDLKTRNRLSAKASRDRKKAYQDTLMQQNNELMAENLELSRLVKSVMSENRGLRKELEGFGCGEKLPERIPQLPPLPWPTLSTGPCGSASMQPVNINSATLSDSCSQPRTPTAFPLGMGMGRQGQFVTYSH